VEKSVGEIIARGFLPHDLCNLLKDYSSLRQAIFDAEFVPSIWLDDFFGRPALACSGNFIWRRASRQAIRN
jgi:hypothetical protein